MTRLIKTFTSKCQSLFSSRQGGAALIVVIAMTGMLAFLGFFFYNFVAQERNSAAWFALPRQTVQDTDYFDYALEQVLIGPTDDKRNSALYGRKFAMIPGVIGTLDSDLKPNDFTPYNGKGVFAVPGNTDNDSLPDLVNGSNGPNGTGGDWDDNIQFQGFDYDGNGTVDALTMNFSPIANPGNPTDPIADMIPYSPLYPDHPFSIYNYQPDVDYTYPDINNMFLSHAQYVDLDPSPGGVNLRLCWIPSFHRPQYLPREARIGANSLFNEPELRNMVLRPHASHVTRRRRNQPASLRYDSTFGFDNPDGGGNWNSGIWEMADPSIAGLVDFVPNYDVDADGLAYNGREAILMDLDHEPEVLSDGTLRIPMFAFTIMDLDGLINLNTAGNLYNEQDALVQVHTTPVAATDRPFGYDNPADPDWIHTSNYGYSTTEVNPCWGFWRPVNAGATPASYNTMFAFGFDGSSGSQLVSQIDMSNMELARLLIGYSDADFSDQDDDIEGRWGEVIRTDSAVAGSRFPPMPLPVPLSNTYQPYALAGRSRSDDDRDFNLGGGKARFANNLGNQDPVFGQVGISIPSTVHPLDEIGTGGSFGVNQAGSGAYFNRRTFGTYTPNRGLYTIASQRIDVGTIGLAQAGEDDFNPSRWISYQGLWENQLYGGLDQDSSINDITHQLNLSGVQPYFNGVQIVEASAAPVLDEDWLQRRRVGAAGDLYRGLADEADEFEAEPLLRDSTYDAAFTPHELQYLHLSQNDWNDIDGSTSRIGQLAEYNLERLTTDDGNFTVTLNEYLRSQFTTDSWDRREPGGFPMPTTFDNSTVSDRNWEYTAEHFTLDPATYGPNQYIAVWPPVYSNQFQTNADPFRYSLRRQLNRLVGYVSTSGTNIDQFITVPDEYKSYQGVGHRLNLNKVLEIDPNNSRTTRYRSLTPHPVFNGSEGITVDAVPDMLHFDVPPNSASLTSRSVRTGLATPGQYNVTFNAMETDKVAQEWWARYDRQRMARDIYVLLYTFCMPDDFDPTAGALTVLNDANGNSVDDRIEEIAQFAVNYVDAIDADDVITRFDYDVNLSNGWDTTYEGDDRLTAFGVEHQQLTCSETLWIRSLDTSPDDPDTPWDDDGVDHDFLFVELRNVAPKDVDLTTGTWRLRLVNNQGSTTDLSDDTTLTTVTFQQGTTGTALSVGAGENFLIGTYNEPGDWPGVGSNTRAASVFALNNGTAEVPIAPYMEHTNSECYELPLCDLDLVHDLHTDTEQRFEEHASAGAFFDLAGLAYADPDDQLRIVLERRMNTRMWDYFANDPDNVGDEHDNDWVEVDRMGVVRRDFDPTTSDYSAAVADLRSFERQQPFRATIDVRRGAGTPSGASSNSLKHSLGGIDLSATGDITDTSLFVGNNINPASYDVDRKHQGNAEFQNGGGEGFTYWQPHFDRPLTSVIDLYSIPLLEPRDLIMNAEFGAGTENWGGLVRGDNQEQTGHRLAERKFINPDLDTTDNSDDNRWHRLLELVDVPNRHEDRNAKLLATARKAGRVNLNTLRHPAVLGAVIDDEYHLAGLDPASGLVTTLNPDGSANAASTEDQFRNSTVQMLRDPIENARNWADQFFLSRDVVDPFTGDPLPGIAGSRPFRGFGHLNSFVASTTDPDAHQGTENTLLRTFSRASVGGMGINSSTDIDATPTSPDRRLFEARANSGSLQQIDTWARNRLLRKVSNLTTTRSHVFACWIHIQFHDATEDANGNVVVGAARPGETKRGFFLLDRSKLEEAFDPQTGRFDFQKFVLSRTIIDE